MFKVLACDQCQKMGKPLAAVQPLQCIKVNISSILVENSNVIMYITY